MQKTQNFNLPQWEAADPIRREDFNAAMAAIDAAGGGVEMVSIDTIDMAAGDTVYTFAKPPKFVLIEGKYVAMVLRQGESAQKMDNYTSSSNYYVTFRLEGTSLVLEARITALAFSTPNIVAFY